MFRHSLQHWLSLLDHSLDGIRSFTTRIQLRVSLHSNPILTNPIHISITRPFLLETMAYMTMARGIFPLFIMTSSLAHALRVSPNSPCTSVCTSSDVSQSDPNFFDEQWKDIVCNDKDFDSKPEGQKLKSCFTCLQNSNYTHGNENDQDWFLCKSSW